MATLYKRLSGRLTQSSASTHAEVNIKTPQAGMETQMMSIKSVSFEFAATPGRWSVVSTRCMVGLFKSSIPTTLGVLGLSNRECICTWQTITVWNGGALIMPPVSNQFLWIPPTAVYNADESLNVRIEASTGAAWIIDYEIVYSMIAVKASQKPSFVTIR